MTLKYVLYINIFILRDTVGGIRICVWILWSESLMVVEENRWVHFPIDEIGRKRIELSAEKIKKEHPEYTGDLGFKHYTVKELDADTVANMEEFDPDKKVVNISGEVTDDTIITTWMCVDGYGKDADVCKIDLGGYSAYMCQNHLYLINAGFKEEHLNALMKRILEEPDFNIKYIVLFGYNFNDWSINEMLEKNTKVIKNSNKALSVDILTRFW